MVNPSGIFFPHTASTGVDILNPDLELRSVQGAKERRSIMPIRVIPAAAQRNFTPGTPDAVIERPKTHVAAYCRVSTEMEEQESSYDVQIRHYTELINGNKSWTLAGIYADEGISGTQTKKREQFNAMIADCENNKIDMVITKSISRFARNTLDCLQYIRKLKALGIPIFFEKENINTMDSSGELLITIMASIAQQESQSISQNVRMGIQYRFQQGKPKLNHTWFLGYTKEKGGDLEIVPEEAEVVRKVYRYFLEGMTIGDIVHQMQKQGYRTGAGRDTWYYSTVQSILKNEKYMGDLILQKGYTVDFLSKKRAKNNGKFPKYYVENAHDPIVPREVFMQVQGEFLRREGVKEVTGEKEVHKGGIALNHRIVCSECGATYKRVHKAIEEQTTWRCRSRMQKGTPCHGRIVKESLVKAVVVKAFQELPGKRDELEKLQERIGTSPYVNVTDQVEILNDEKEELQDEMSRKAEYGIRSIHIRILLELIDAMEGKEIEQYVPESPACFDYADFFARTSEIRHHGPFTEYSDDDVLRYVEKIEVCPDKLSVVFKAGVVIDIPA